MFSLLCMENAQQGIFHALGLYICGFVHAEALRELNQNQKYLINIAHYH